MTLRDAIGWLFVGAGALGLAGWLLVWLIKLATRVNERRNRTRA